ncbi:thymus-specific serine protease [Pristis pectinata]|uniref:thymus-specific serine protease n=1 Tax=Pristis pectinata TaxID=685728 RepID=UPI00223D80EC|nr:thymus-specific serine protease [Pristis pectinata]
MGGAWVFPELASRDWARCPRRRSVGPGEMLLPALVVFWAGLLSLSALGLGGRNIWLIKEKVLQSREQRAQKYLLETWKSFVAVGSGEYLEPSEEYFPQPLDHFNRQNKATYKQRYWVNTELWEPEGGPVFLYIGGEGGLTVYSVLAGEHVELARKYKALLVSVEHRYYGASINPDGLTDQNLQFLSSQQALADLATFHAFISQQYNLTKRNPWICFGGSYPGSLSAWFRLKFPHLVYAAVASSAPVRARLDFTAYNKVVSQSLSNPVVGGSLKCRDAVAQAFSQLDQVLVRGETSRLESDFSSCQSLNGTGDYGELASNLADIVMGTVQYNLEEPGNDIADLCRVMTDQNLGSPYRRLVVLNKGYLERMALNCTDNSHQETLEVLRSTVVKPFGVGERQWYYQTCAEFGYYQTCEDEGCPLSRWLTLQSQVDICAQVFGISANSVQSAVDFTNDYYGADRPKSSRIIFVNGDIDPWHALSVLKNQSRSELAVVINGTAHCANMNPPEKQDPTSLRQARQRIDDQIGVWLASSRLNPW